MTVYNFVTPLSATVDGACYIIEGEVAAVIAYIDPNGLYGMFNGSRILLKGGGEVIVRNKPEEIIALIKLESQ